jgi:hypothetical protein
MIHESHRRSRRQANAFTKEIELLALEFFIACRKKEPKEIREIYIHFSRRWANRCRAVNMNLKRDIQLHGDEFEQVTKLAYSATFVNQKKSSGRSHVLRTIKAIENKPLLIFWLRDLYLSFYKLLSGK